MTTQEQIEVLEKTLEWIDNLKKIIGYDPLIDAMPNNFGGRFAIRDVIRDLERKEEEKQDKQAFVDAVAMLANAPRHQ